MDGVERQLSSHGYDTSKEWKMNAQNFASRMKQTFIRYPESGISRETKGKHGTVYWVSDKKKLWDFARRFHNYTVKLPEEYKPSATETNGLFIEE